jgi:hypothetical protein
LVTGTVGETILMTLTHGAGGTMPQLCVVGARGLSAWKRLLAGLADSLLLTGLGSTSDHLVHHAPFPVCVVKAPKREKHQD